MCVPGKQRIFWAIFETKKKKTTNKQEIQPPANPKPHHPKATRTQVQKTSSKRQDTSLKGRGRLWVGGTAEGPQIRCFTINTYCNVQSQYWTGTTSPGEIKAQHFLRVHTGAWGQSEGRTYRANQRQARRGAGSKTRGLKNSLVPLPFQSRNIQDPHQNILSQSRDYASKESDQVQDQPLKTQFWKTCTAPKRHSSPSDTALCESVCPERVYVIKKKVLMTAGMANRTPSSPAALEGDLFIVILAIYNFNQKNR